LCIAVSFTCKQEMGETPSAKIVKNLAIYVSLNLLIIPVFFFRFACFGRCHMHVNLDEQNAQNTYEIIVQRKRAWIHKTSLIQYAIFCSTRV
jgi:hypothetical protein